jgi:predicted dehydrogenase
MGYVGCGFMAQKVHLPNLVALRECDLLGIAELRQELGRKVQARFGIPRLYPSHRELAADREIQAVAVSGHFSGQGEIAMDLLRAGKDVFMEKPMAVSAAQAERILAAERQSGRRLMIGYMKRYDAGNLLVKDLVGQFRRTGELGALRYVRNHGFCGNWTAGLDTPMENTEEPMPQVTPACPSWMPEEFHKRYISYLQQYTHNINLVRWFLDAGDDVKLRAVDLDRRNGTAGVVILEVGGIRTVVESGGLAYHGWDEHTQLYFERGWVRTCAPPLLMRNMPATVEVYRGEATSSSSEMFPPSGYTWSYKEEMRHFIQCVRDGTPFRSPAADALADVRTLEEIYRVFVGQCAGTEPAAGA